MREHWASYGRDVYTRHDYEEIDAQVAADLMSALRDKLPSLPGQRFGELTVRAADDFTYTDPVDGSITPNQGIRITFQEDAEPCSGCPAPLGTIRVYLERYVTNAHQHGPDFLGVLEEVIAAADAIADLSLRTGRHQPSELWPGWFSGTPPTAAAPPAPN